MEFVGNDASRLPVDGAHPVGGGYEIEARLSDALKRVPLFIEGGLFVHIGLGFKE
jgi:hypothetical protein